jgi:hypothetical protein
MTGRINMEKKLSAVETLKKLGIKENPNIPNVAIFIPNKPKKSKKKEKK